MSHRPAAAPTSHLTTTGLSSAEGDRAARIDRLTERLALMQSDLGGLFYEMAIRDHLQLDLLVERAAAMQRIEEELHALQSPPPEGERP